MSITRGGYTKVTALISIIGVIIAIAVFKNYIISAGAGAYADDNIVTSEEIAVVSEGNLKKYLVDGNIGGLIKNYNSNIIITKGSEILRMNSNRYELVAGSVVILNNKGAAVTLETPAVTINGGYSMYHATSLMFGSMLIAVLEGSVSVRNETDDFTLNKYELAIISRKGLLFRKQFKDIEHIYNSNDMPAKAELPSGNNRKDESREPFEVKNEDIAESINKEEATIIFTRKRENISSFIRYSEEKFGSKTPAIEEMLKSDIKRKFKAARRNIAKLSYAKRIDLEDVMPNLRKEKEFMEDVSYENAESQKLFDLINRVSNAGVFTKYAVMHVLPYLMGKELSEEQQIELVNITHNFLGEEPSKQQYELKTEISHHDIERAQEFHDRIREMGLADIETELFCTGSMYRNATYDITRDNILFQMEWNGGLPEEIIEKYKRDIDLLVDSLLTSRSRLENAALLLGFHKDIVSKIENRGEVDGEILEKFREVDFCMTLPFSNAKDKYEYIEKSGLYK